MLEETHEGPRRSERASRRLDFGPKRFVSAGLLVAALAVAGSTIAIVGRGGMETFRTAPPPSPGTG